ncbi:hypothetical protein BGZ61DRAFT_143909 [Ilyonectria robusta]|uniref:uncharacterized protein n=1 Tax=Ilyonectria robusta TaxID=1079257 RepID=UPI001E8EB6BA|nr:uncharacterized protein BGZ61DRAFT_143909 [Ilyonectria robusta]KAH8662686.1 hypothetical protein BGZ61DRAFT_143909 [Ilyonectria robusta]
MAFALLILAVNAVPKEYHLTISLPQACQSVGLGRLLPNLATRMAFALLILAVNTVPKEYHLTISLPQACQSVGLG